MVVPSPDDVSVSLDGLDESELGDDEVPSVVVDVSVELELEDEVAVVFVVVVDVPEDCADVVLVAPLEDEPWDCDELVVEPAELG